MHACAGPGVGGAGHDVLVTFKETFERIQAYQEAANRQPPTTPDGPTNPQPIVDTTPPILQPNQPYERLLENTTTRVAVRTVIVVGDVWADPWVTATDDVDTGIAGKVCMCALWLWVWMCDSGDGIFSVPGCYLHGFQ